MSRVRAFNSVALANFIIQPFEKFFSKKIMEICSSRRKLKTDWLRHKEVAKPVSCNKVDEKNVFELKLQHNTYMVDLDSWFCSCPYGTHGKFCKHLIAVAQWNNIALPIGRLIIATPKTKQLLCYIATG